MRRILTFPTLFLFVGLCMLGISIATLAWVPHARQDSDTCGLVTASNYTGNPLSSGCPCQDYVTVVGDTRVTFCQPDQRASVSTFGGRAILTCTCVAPAGDP